MGRLTRAFDGLRRFGIGALLATACWLCCAGARAAPMQHVFLVQNSGWMEPFYAAPQSQFKALVGTVVGTVARADDTVIVAAFNQSTPDNRSPALLYRGKGPGNAAQSLAPLTIPTKNKAGALADTDFQEAVDEAKRQLGAQPGIIWIFTNNKNSPNNDPQTLRRNEEFYRVLHLDASITRTLAFPHRMPLKGKRYEATGLMVYALAYGDAASAHLAALLDAGVLGKVFANPPARLKPIDRESVQLVLKAVANNSENVSVGTAKDGRTLLVDVHASSVLPLVEIKTALRNLFYPYVIAQARPAASLAGTWGRSAVAIRPERIEQVQPGEQRDVTVSLPMPLGQVPSPWSPAAVRAMGKPVTIPAVLQVSLADQRLVLSDGFKRLLEELFPGDPLPRVFLPPQDVRSSSVSQPLVIRIHYSSLPLVAAMAGGLLLLGGAVALLVLAGRAARYEVTVDGAKRAVAVKAFGTQQVRAADGTVVGSVKRGLGRPRVTQVAPGHTIVVK